jgi:hypothetical protein
MVEALFTKKIWIMKGKEAVKFRFNILVFIVVMLLLSSCNIKLNKEHPQITKGEMLYQKYCLECHAQDGEGIKELKAHYDKIDLTRINLRRDLDEFPVNEIARYIDGRTHYKEFGPRPMPMWGVDLMAKENQFNPDSTKSNLGAIISYLIKIQK